MRIFAIAFSERKVIRLWAQNLRVLSTVHSPSAMDISVYTLWDICPLELHHWVVT